MKSHFVISSNCKLHTEGLANVFITTVLLRAPRTAAFYEDYPSSHSQRIKTIVSSYSLPVLLRILEPVYRLTDF